MSKSHSKSTGLLHTRTRRKYKLITDSEEIEQITKRFSLNPRPRCSGCKKPTIALKADYGKSNEERQEEIAQYCPRCKVIFPIKLVVVATYDY